MNKSFLLIACAVTLGAACSRNHAATPIPAAIPSTAAQAAWLLPGEMPDPPPASFLGLIGEYDAPAGMRLVLEDAGQLWIADTVRHSAALRVLSANDYSGDVGRLLGTDGGASRISFARDASGRAQAMLVGTTHIPRRNIEPAAGTNQLRITPLRPVEELRVEALAAKPPAEHGSFRKPDLVELTSLDPSIKLEIRYATTNNFLGTRFYSQARAFMQRPTAEAVVRAHRLLKPLGYGLLIHDAYRPWYVTKMFWDATPSDKRWLVANPAEGSKHNRGAAVDLTMFELGTGKPVDMPSTYDESTDRAYADYPGGTALQRWHRALLRRVMESQGFTVNPTEWWHFDYKDWQQYSIGNTPFERIGRE